MYISNGRRISDIHFEWVLRAVVGNLKQLAGIAYYCTTSWNAYL